MRAGRKREVIWGKVVYWRGIYISLCAARVRENSPKRNDPACTHNPDICRFSGNKTRVVYSGATPSPHEWTKKKKLLLLRADKRACKDCDPLLFLPIFFSSFCSPLLYISTEEREREKLCLCVYIYSWCSFATFGTSFICFNTFTRTFISLLHLQCCDGQLKRDFINKKKKESFYYVKRKNR